MHRGADVRDFAHGAARVLARAVPFEGVCVLTIDPATLVPTGEVVLRGSDCRPFSSADAALVEDVTRHLAEGLRRALLLADDDPPEAPNDEDGAGVVVLARRARTAVAAPRRSETTPARRSP
jgi:hypothetical protein